MASRRGGRRIQGFFDSTKDLERIEERIPDGTKRLSDVLWPKNLWCGGSFMLRTWSDIDLGVVYRRVESTALSKILLYVAKTCFENLLLEEGMKLQSGAVTDQKVDEREQSKVLALIVKGHRK